MPSPILETHSPPVCEPPAANVDAEVLAAYGEDASGAPPGHGAAVVRPRSRDEAAVFLSRLGAGDHVLCQAARSSLTGGAIPHGETVLNVERLNRIDAPRRGSGAARVRVEAGVRLDELQSKLAGHGLYFPPVPTYQQAMIGGTCATNAGGAATFKYGVTRDWVHGLELLLFNGDRLEIERGEVLASRGGFFRMRLSEGRLLEVPVPVHRLPALKKISAGYHAAEPLDLVDLLVGSEGTLGLITAVSLDLVPLPEGVLGGLVFCRDTAAALRLTASLRRAATRARARNDPRGPDLRSIEYLDRRSLDLVRRSPLPARHRLALPETAGAALLFELELPRRRTRDEIETEMAGWFDGTAQDGPLSRLLALLDGEGVLDSLEVAFPDDDRARDHAALREGPPTLLAERLADVKRRHPEVRKIAGDMIVPFEALGEMLDVYRRGFADRGLDHAIWGHISDGNLHANALPQDGEQVRMAEQALLEFADEAIRRGGAPLSEHGVGRDPVKQELLRRFVGEPAIEGMRRVRRALDPPGRFAPGVLFPS